MKNRRSFGSAAFTLVELLVVISIIALLVAILLPAIRAAMVKSERVKAAGDCKSIATAVSGFIQSYSRRPVPAADASSANDKTYDDTNSKEIIKILTASETGSSVQNTRKTVFLNETQSGTTDGTFMDPWDKQYRIIIDNNFDDTISFDDGSGGGAKSFKTVCIVVSAGPNGTFDTSGSTADDINSLK